jgi:hypothetical protein
MRLFIMLIAGALGSGWHVNGAFAQEWRSVQVGCPSMYSFPEQPKRPSTVISSMKAVQAILHDEPSWRHLSAQSWTAMRRLWLTDSVGTEWGLAYTIADARGVSEEDALMAAVFYRELSGRLTPLLAALDAQGDESRRYYALASVAKIRGPDEETAVVVFACDAAILIAFAAELQRAPEPAHSIPDRARWPARERLVLAESARLATGPLRGLVLRLCEELDCRTPH